MLGSVKGTRRNVNESLSLSTAARRPLIGVFLRVTMIVSLTTGGELIIENALALVATPIGVVTLIGPLVARGGTDVVIIPSALTVEFDTGKALNRAAVAPVDGRSARV